MPVPVHLLAGTEDYLSVLAGHRQVFAPGERFAYNNSAFVVLALIAERVSGVPFERLVQERVCAPAGMRDTAFLRSDEPAGRAALGYLDAHGHRTNLLHLPVLGSGDGGISSTAADIHAFWVGAVLGPNRLPGPPRGDRPTAKRRAVGIEALRPGPVAPPHQQRRDARGLDAGVSFRSLHDPDAQLTYTVLSNTTDGAWPIARHLDELLAP